MLCSYDLDKYIFGLTLTLVVVLKHFSSRLIARQWQKPSCNTSAIVHSQPQIWALPHCYQRTDFCALIQYHGSGFSNIYTCDLYIWQDSLQSQKKVINYNYKQKNWGSQAGVETPPFFCHLTAWQLSRLCKFTTMLILHAISQYFCYAYVCSVEIHIRTQDMKLNRLLLSFHWGNCLFKSMTMGHRKKEKPHLYFALKCLVKYHLTSKIYNLPSQNLICSCKPGLYLQYQYHATRKKVEEDSMWSYSFHISYI